MRIVLGTISKFHTFDLARQLYHHDMLTKVFSGYPWFKLSNEKLPRTLVDTYPWIVAPHMLLSRYRFTHGRLLRGMDELSHELFAQHVAKHMPECDIFHGLSRYSLRPGRKAKSRGAIFALDVGSSHIQTQVDLLTEEAERACVRVDLPHPNGIERELQEYTEADIITLPSEFAVSSFLEKGVPRTKIVKVPYGVDLTNFHPVDVEQDNKFRVLFIGSLSLWKGVHYLARAFMRANIPNSELVLIGSANDQTQQLLDGVEKYDNIILPGHVPQPNLKYWLSRATVFVLPSIQDGYGLVLLQALACGCPVIATPHTGGPECIEEGKNGFIVPIRDVDALAERLTWLSEHPEEASEMRQHALASAEHAHSIERYGENMIGVYHSLTQKNNRLRD